MGCLSVSMKVFFAIVNSLPITFRRLLQLFEPGPYRYTRAISEVNFPNCPYTKLAFIVILHNQ